jgi:NADH-ubiquinone oxidoreductase chain 5
MLTALTNRLGDIFILIFIGINCSPGIFNIVAHSSCTRLNYEWVVLIMLAAITKRAQIPFSAWLPAAIAAPTPVSALVHSSTLVTAGVYLLLRFNLLLCNNMFVILMLGCITMVMAGVSGLTESDMKKIIALSTLSQLGVMFFSVGLGEVFLRYFHLISHAYFKAIIFICAGAIIHRIGDYQDLRKIGGG